MKIIEVHIYGYGKLENVTIDNLSNLTVFYGENEAGKSTIMSFIHSILFGFPTKQQTELRYEPKKGAKYGGKLVVQFETEGKTIIERMKGKATGDVTVLLEDGTIGGEELLKELLSNVDKNLYQSIFSFNLHGLQNVHHLKSEDLGKFLFSTGTIGSERLLTVENNLQKELDNRFKPNGKKPSINEKLIEVKEVYSDLKNAEQKNDQYGSLLKEVESTQTKIEDKGLKQSELQKKLHQLEEWKKLAPIVKERKLLQEELENLQNVSFPVDGMSRLERLSSMLQPIEGQMKALQEKKDRLKEELKEQCPNRDMLDRELEINTAVEHLALYEALKEEEAEWQSKRTKILREIKDVKERLHIPLSNESLEKCNTSIFMGEKTEKAQLEQRRIKERKMDLDESFNQEKAELEKIEIEIERMKKDLLPPQEREEKNQRMEISRNYDSLKKELQSIQDKLHLLKMTDKKEIVQQKQNRAQMMLLCLLFILLAAWGIWSSQWLMVVMGGIGAIMILVFFLQKKKSGMQFVIMKEAEELKDREQVIKEHLSSKASFTEIELIEEQLQKDSLLQEQLNVLQLRWSQQSAQYEKVIHSFEEWEKRSIVHKKQLLALGEELHLPEDIALNYIHDAFLLIVKLKNLMMEYEHIQNQLEKKTHQLQKIHQDIQQLGTQFLKDSASSIRETAFLLKKQLKAELGKNMKYEEIREKLKEIKNETQSLTEEWTYLHNEKEKLYQLAKANSEEEFRLAGKEDVKHTNLLNKIEELSRQIQLSSIEEEEMNELINLHDPDEEIQKKKVEWEACEQDIQDSRDFLAELKHQVALLEDGGVYTQILHKYRLLQSELEIEAKEWARLAVAKDMLRKTVDRFKNEHLPNMLTKAEEYLSFLTDGNYLRIIPKMDSSGFLIERKDRILFEANELSQATTEQVYVSLRLALATTIYKKYSFPILIDDSFVNFDATRTEKVIQLLKTIAGNQILFFTCHKHLLPYFSQDQIISMKGKTSLQVHP